MNSRSLTLVVVVLGSVAGCPDPEPGRNPAILWLAPDGVETEVKLIAAEPRPF